MENPKRSARKRSKIIICIVIGIAAIALVVGAYFLISLQNYRKDVAAIQTQNVNLATVDDGEYFGNCDVGLVSARVRVVVENHAIIAIELLEHNNGRGAPAESIPDEIIREQRIDVEAVSGATASSKVITEAVFNALSENTRR